MSLDDDDRADESLRELREAWRRLGDAANADDAGHAAVGADDASLALADEATRASVEWMRRAWRSLEREAGTVPLPLARAAARRAPAKRRRVRRATRLALAALGAAAAVLSIARVSTRESAPDEPERVASLAPQAALVEPMPALVQIPPERFRTRPDGFEVVTGSVRIVWLNREDPVTGRNP